MEAPAGAAVTVLYNPVIRYFNHQDMRKIEYRVIFSEVKCVVIREIGGAGGMWHVYIDNFYQGAVTKKQGEWVFVPQIRGNWSYEDILVVAELVASEVGE